MPEGFVSGLDHADDAVIPARPVERQAVVRPRDTPITHRGLALEQREQLEVRRKLVYERILVRPLPSRARLDIRRSNSTGSVQTSIIYCEHSGCKFRPYLFCHLH